MHWYRLAAEQGLEDAKYQLAVLENSKGPQQPVGKIINFPDIHKKNKTRTRDRPIEGMAGEALSNSTNVLTEEMRNDLIQEIKKELKIEIKKAMIAAIDKL